MNDSSPPSTPTTPTPETEITAQSVFDQVGGQAFFDRLVERFYQGVENDPVMRPMYPDDSVDPGLGEARRKFAWFLGQYWGGPTSYSDERGHPRLRMRHNPFTIGNVERDHWFAHMKSAVLEAELSPDLEAQMLIYFERAATAMINSPSGL